MGCKVSPNITISQTQKRPVFLRGVHYIVDSEKLNLRILFFLAQKFLQR